MMSDACHDVIEFFSVT